MFQFLYVTDLHGWTPGYEMTLDLARDLGIHVVVNGGDMLPKGRSLDGSLAEAINSRTPPKILKTQLSFIEDFLSAYCEECKLHGIRYLAMFGNDDLRANFNAWQEIVRRYSNVDDLTTTWHALDDGLVIRGCSYVPDAPFRLKDWLVWDAPGFVSPPQSGTPVLSHGDGLQEISDTDAFFKSRPSLEQILDRLVDRSLVTRFDRVILVSHSPPAETGLAILHDGTDVGSVTQLRWIDQHQPLLTLHGHIHESPDVSGADVVRRGRTVCHNPGQHAPAELTVSVITVESDHVHIERRCLPAPK